MSAGTYYLSETLVLDDRDCCVNWVGDHARLVGGRALTGQWRPSPDDPSIWSRPVPDEARFDQLFVNRERMVLARYPSEDRCAPRLEGTTTLDELHRRSSGYRSVDNALVRAMHCRDWGSVSFRVIGRSHGQLDLEFVGDNNRAFDCDNPALPLKAAEVLIENVCDELDADGEWFHDVDSAALLLKPPPGVDLNRAVVETGELTELIRLNGRSLEQLVCGVSFTGFIFTGTHRTLFCGDFEPISRSDWAVVRAAALHLIRTRGVSVEGCRFVDLGGNALLVDGHNDEVAIRGNHFEGSGASHIQLLGWPDAVRDYADNYFTTPPISDLAAGPRSENYPRSVLIQGNTMTWNGRYEKQSSAVNIGIALDVTVRGNTMSNSPRACLNFCDTTWGGHRIEHNDLFHAVLETGDNGTINAWGRSRFWRTGAASDRFASLAEGISWAGCTGTELNAAQAKAVMQLDTIRPITITHNRLHHQGDWAIDLDDGSSLFEVSDNLLLAGGIKLRDGFCRTVRNNLLVDGTIYEQVSYADGGDVIEHNLILGPLAYRNVLNDPLTARYQADHNLFWNGGEPIEVIASGGAAELFSSDGRTVNRETSWALAGLDRSSVVADPGFDRLDDAGHDFTIGAHSPALSIGFVPFSMTGFGAPGGDLPPPARVPDRTRTRVEPIWFQPLLGCEVTRLSSMADRSAYAISDSFGLRLVIVPEQSPAARCGLLANDLIRAVDGRPVTESDSFAELCATAEQVSLTVRRASADLTVIFIPQKRQ